MSQIKVIISKTQVFVTGYAKVGATILFKENHNCKEPQAVINSDAVNMAKAVAFDYACSGTRCVCSVLIADNATESEVLDGKFNNSFI